MDKSEMGHTESVEQPIRLPEPPPGMIRVDKTELVWLGKYDEQGNLPEPPRVNLPFQVIERVNESRATREAKKAAGPILFEMYHAEEGPTFEAGWRNKLIWGDNLLVMSSLLEKFAGEIDLIYIDPPFATGADFSFTTPIGDSGIEVTKSQSLMEEKAYRDTWGRGVASYVQMMRDRLSLMCELLSNTGSIYIHCDWRVNSHLRLIMDELLGPQNFQREIVWDISVLSGFKTKANNWIRGHDTILFYSKSDAMVHIGAVDAPVTIDEISLAIEECARLKQPELHVLGWEWEMGLAGPNNEYRKGGLMQDEARKKGIKLLLLQIPREVMEQQAAAKEDVRFFELAYLDVKVGKPKKLTVQVTLKDFVILNTELIPEDVRAKIKKWSDYIDYWAVDWDFQDDTFLQGWVAYRTRKERKLPLESDPHTYDKPGTYRVLIKVIDIFGNDTSQAHTVEVK